MKKKISKIINLLLLTTMLILIFLVSPKITFAIKNLAKYLYELKNNDITRVVELILSSSLVASIFITKNTIKNKK